MSTKQKEMFQLSVNVKVTQYFGDSWTDGCGVPHMIRPVHNEIWEVTVDNVPHVVYAGVEAEDLITGALREAYCRKEKE